MNAIAIALATFASTFTGSLCGLFLRHLLPDNHLNDDARDVVKLGSGLIATIAALILGLLINSANNSLDTMNNELTETSATLVELDQTLASFGSETVELRQILRKIVAAVLETIGPENILKAGNTEKIDIAEELRKIQRKLRIMEPKNNAETMLQSQAIEEVNQLTYSRTLLLEHKKRHISGILLIVLIFWLNAIFISFGLLAPRNRTVIGILFICAISISAAVFILMEMNNPYNGFINVSVGPWIDAQVQMSK